MMFLIFGDNISHMHFNIWRLPQLLRFYKTKFDPTSARPKRSHVQPKKQKFHHQNHNRKNTIPWPNITYPTKIFPQPKISYPTKIFHTKKKKSQAQQKFSIIKVPWPIQKIHATTKFTHANKFSALIMNLFNQAYTTNFS